MNHECGVDEDELWYSNLSQYKLTIINNDLIKEEDGEFNDTDEDKRNSMLESSNESVDDKTINKCDNNICDSMDDQIIFVEDIILKDPSTMRSCQIIQDECNIAYFIQVLFEGGPLNKIMTNSLDVKESDLIKKERLNIKQKECNYYKNDSGNKTIIEKLKDISKYLSWIGNASQILADRIGQKTITYVGNAEYPCIIRSSYNFCHKYNECKEFYSKKDEPICSNHHYVHAILKYDIDSLISFLEYIVEDESRLDSDNINNIYSSIKTICFVTRHMAKEIVSVDQITKKDSEFFHRNNPFGTFRKKGIKKISKFIDTTKPTFCDLDRDPFIYKETKYSSQDKEFDNHKMRYYSKQSSVKTGRSKQFNFSKTSSNTNLCMNRFQQLST